MRRLADGFTALKHSSGSLGGHIHHDFGLLAVDEFGGFSVAEGPAPGLLEADDVGAVTLGHLGHAVAEETVSEDGDLRARLDEVADGGFHSAAAGGGDDECPLVLGAENAAQHTLVVMADL